VNSDIFVIWTQERWWCHCMINGDTPRAVSGGRGAHGADKRRHSAFVYLFMAASSLLLTPQQPPPPQTESNLYSVFVVFFFQSHSCTTRACHSNSAPYALFCCLTTAMALPGSATAVPAPCAAALPPSAALRCGSSRMLMCSPPYAAASASRRAWL